MLTNLLRECLRKIYALKLIVRQYSNAGKIKIWVRIPATISVLDFLVTLAHSLKTLDFIEELRLSVTANIFVKRPEMT